MKIILAQPRGFCAGVERAIKIVDQALELYPNRAIYVYHEIVHNRYILSYFRDKGVIFVESVDDVPHDSILIFSAHGVSKRVITQAKNNIRTIIDATCPLVTKVHNEIQNNELNEYENILIGHKGHQEVIGTVGQAKNKVLLVQSISDVKNLQVQNPDKLSYVTQTTLSVDDTKDIISALKDRFPNIKGPNLKDICYATQNRQNAVKELAKIVDIVFVVGSKNSSNSNRLCEVARTEKIPAYLIDSYESIDLNALQNINKIGITAGASAPEILVEQIIIFLNKQFNDVKISTMEGKAENVTFKLPKELVSNQL